MVENGSDPDQGLGARFVEEFGSQFRYVDMGRDGSASPVAAMNRGLADATGRSLALMIDGAHVLTPRVLHYGLAGLEAYEPAVVAAEHYADLRGRPFRGPEKPIQFVGSFHTGLRQRSRARRMTARAFNIDRRLEGDDGPALPSPVPVADDLRDAFTAAHYRSLVWRETRWLGHRVPNAATT